MTRSNWVTTEIVRAKRGVIVATGSRPRGLPGVEFDGQRVINSDHATLAGKLPKSVVIVGGGAIGVTSHVRTRRLSRCRRRNWPTSR